MEDFLCISWVQSEGARGVLKSFLTDNEFGVYRPVSIHVYYGLCRFLFGLNPVGYHLVSLLSHVANVLLVFFLVLALTGNQWMGFLAGAIYLSRMSHYIGVFWAAGINEVWLALFYLISLGSFVLFWKKKRFIFYGISIFAFLLALGCKESAIMLPFTVLGYGLIYHRKHLSKLLKSCLPFFILLLGYLILKLVVFKPMVGRTYEAGVGLWLFRNFISYILFQFNITYLALVVAKLIADISLLKYLQSAKIILSLLGFSMISLVFLLYICRGKFARFFKDLFSAEENRIGAMGFMFFLITLTPALLLRNRIQQYYLMTPSIGFSIGMAWLLEKYLRKYAAAAFVVLLLAGAFVGFWALGKLPDGRTTTLAKPFLEDLRSILKTERKAETVYVKNSDGFICQVLWYGAAFNAFLDRPVAVVLDVQDIHFVPTEGTLTVTYQNGRLRKDVETGSGG